MVDTARLSGERLAEFERDRHESNRRYDYAFSVVLSHTSALELQEFSKLVGLGDGVRWLADSGTAAGANRSFSLGPAAMEEGIAHARGVRKKRSYFAEENPMAGAEGWRSGAVKDERSGSTMADTIEFDHANPALDESGAAAEPSQLGVRAV